MRSTLCALVLMVSVSQVSASVVVTYWEVGGVALAQTGAVIDVPVDNHEYVTTFEFRATYQHIESQNPPVYQTLNAYADPADYNGPPELFYLSAKAVSNTTYSLDLSNGVQWDGSMDFAEYHTPDTVIGDNFYNGQAHGNVYLDLKFTVFNVDALMTYGEDHFTTTYEPGIFTDASRFTLTNVTTGQVLWDANTDGYSLTDLVLAPGEYLISGQVGQFANGVPGTTTETYSRAVSLTIVPEVGSMGLIGLALSGCGVLVVRRSKV